MQGKKLWFSFLSITLLVVCVVSESSGGKTTSTNESTTIQSASTTPSPQSQSPRPYSNDLAKLRAEFNHDKGKVRMVTLLSPT